VIHGAIELEVHRHPGHEDAEGPWDFLDVTFDSESWEVMIFTDEPWASVSARVERIDIVVEETAEHAGWGLLHPRVGNLILGGDGRVLPAPPPGSRPVKPGTRV
jgi:hypothetical protein